MSGLPLIDAVRRGNLDAVRRLLAEGHDPNEHGEPLSEKEMKGVKWILNNASTDAAAETIGQALDITPLMAAAEEGHAEAVETLLAAGADVNVEDSLKRRAIMVAIRWKQEAIARRLLDAGSDPTAKDLSGDPVLTQAIHAKLWPLANALLDAGAKAQPQGKKDCMPLAVVSYKQGEAAASLTMRLLDMGAKPDGPQFLANLVQGQSGEVLRRVLRDFPELANASSHDELLELAGKRRDVEIIQSLVESGVRPTNGATEPSPLSGVIIGPPRSSLDFFAPEHINDAREIAGFEALVAAGADVNHAPSGQSLPLHWVIYFCRSGLCRWLLDHGANPNIRENGKSLVEYAEQQWAETAPNDLHDEEETIELRRRQGELRKMITMLVEAGSTESLKQPSADVDKSAKRSRRPPSRLEQSLDIPGTPVGQRRGVCDASFSKAEQVMLRADADKIAGMFAKDSKVERVERDISTCLKDIPTWIGDVLALVKLKGQDWVYVAGARRNRGDSPMKGWSKTLKSPVLCAGEQSTAGVVYYWLYDRGECVETFESDGQWFCGGVEIDPEIHDESERMAGTTFTSLRREAESVDWTAYESEYEFLDKFLRDEDAYLTFIGVGPAKEDAPYSLWAYHDDEVAAEAIERVDLVLYKPTPQQIIAEAQPDPKSDPLLQAVKASNKDAVIAAMRAGTDVNALPPHSSASYLVLAIERALYFSEEDDETIIDLLLEAGADPNNGGDQPALCRVATWAGPRVVTLRVMHKLIEAGADVNARKVLESPNLFMPDGQTPLMQVAQSARLNYVKLLLKYGANPTLKDGAGRTALDYAAHWLREVKKDRLKDVPAFTDETYEPIAKENVELLESAIEVRLDIASLPNVDELIAAETMRVAERRRRRN